MTDVALRDHLERQISDQERLLRAEMERLRAELATRQDAADKALILKANELERRLELLNGEAGRLATVLNASVPRELWEQGVKAQQVVNENVARTLSELAGRDRGVSASWGVLLGVVALVSALVGLAVLLATRGV